MFHASELMESVWNKLQQILLDTSKQLQKQSAIYNQTTIPLSLGLFYCLEA